MAAAGCSTLGRVVEVSFKLVLSLMPGMLLYLEHYFEARGGGVTLHLRAEAPSLKSFLEIAGPEPSSS